MDNQIEKEAAMKRLPDELLGKEKDNKSIFIISGPPGAGKTAYVIKNKTASDLAVDMDLLAAALQGEKITHPIYEVVMDAVLAAREAIYSTIEKRQGKWNSAYVITASPDERYVNKLVNRLQGKLVNLDVGEEVCIERIMKDDTRVNKQRDIELAKQWYESRKRSK